jgi:hydrogenase expression/formation protein HypE
VQPITDTELIAKVLSYNKKIIMKEKDIPIDFSLTCPIPISDYPTVLMAHGGGGTLMNQLIERMFVKSFDNEKLNNRHDSATFKVDSGKMAFTTDSYVVSPIFFPGGDIGSLAIHGTVNDLSMSGAKPLYLSAGFIIEEGLPMEKLWRVVNSMREAANEAGVKIITGDTKVVDRGKGDGIYINTAGVGVCQYDVEIHANKIQPGDAVIVNGDLGRHGMAIMAAREDLGFEAKIESDSASLVELVQVLMKSGIEIHCMRDLTRGGLVSALNEIAGVSSYDITVNESSILIYPEVDAFCEVLGVDPLYSANEGKMVLFVRQEDAEKAIEVMKTIDTGRDSSVIGKVNEEKNGSVMITNAIGSTRMLPMNSGEQLPRIC